MLSRRDLIRQTSAALFLLSLGNACGRPNGGIEVGNSRRPRVRPGDADWPDEAQWQTLADQVGGRLISPPSPLAACSTSSDGDACQEVLSQLGNPYYVGDDPALTQTLGWADAWTSTPSSYVVHAESAADVVAAVNFAREHNLRVVIKGGGHSYQGTSNSADSLLIWTRAMNSIEMHEGFVARGCAEVQPPQPAVSVGAGCIWMHVYDAVTTQGGRYVQGGGCATVGVAGLIQSGGFGSHSKRFGLAAAGLIEAEIVTADGQVRIANACTNPDLFWALKGGGGGSLGVVTRLTLRTHDLPTHFAAAIGNVRASSDTAFRELIDFTMRFYNERLFNPDWGEQIRFEHDNSIRITMLGQGMDQQQVDEVWRPFREWVATRSDNYRLDTPITTVAFPARQMWDPSAINQYAPGQLVHDNRPGAPANNYYWSGDGGEAAQFLHGYRSAWLPAALLAESVRSRLVDAIFAATRHWSLSLHFNKGLAGGPEENITAARDTATHPDVLGAFALVIIAGSEPHVHPAIAGHHPDIEAARRDRAAIDAAMAELLRAAPGAGSYLSESDYFEADWRRSFWGSNYNRLTDVKRRYDPDGLFFVHHGVGSDEWSADGFTPVGE